MSNDDCKQRFKGVENFLRRVAFNLGNTPSQTEVKVISCIPIDVTDLQQKIIDLEKQLGAANCKRLSRSQVQINTIVCNTSVPNISDVANSSKAINCPQSNNSSHCPDLTAERSNNSIISPSGPCAAGCVSSDLSDMAYIKKRKQSECRKRFFNKKKDCKKKKMRTHLVYYAQTEERTPFNQYHQADEGTSKNRGNDYSNAFERSYLSDMVRKQFRPNAGNVDLDASEFSTPICRDFVQAQNVKDCLDVESHASDMCSCCHGPFRNIDKHMSIHNNCDIYSSQTESKNTYYDSKFYDVVPVKENSVKIKNFDSPKRKDNRYLNKKQIDMSCWAGRPRCKDMPPIIVNYNTTGPMRQHFTRMPDKSNRKEKISKYNVKYQPQNRVHNVPVNVKKNVTRTCSVEVSEVYARRLEKSRPMIITPKPTVKKLNDAACLTNTIVNTECQTASGINAVSSENKNTEVINVTASEDKTKVTLNQIKDILQSVLTEVKTNSKISNISSQTKKKDAVVQNGLSQSNMFGGSSLLQTYTYGPYDVDPYVASCSQQIQNSSLCYPNMPPGSAKCMQQYPLFVQPGRNMCTSCYNPSKNNHTAHRLPNMKRAASTATNTEDLRERSKETENLIREIYKAMALNIDVVAADSPVKEHGDSNKSIQHFNTVSEDIESKHLASAISEIFKNTNPIETSVTQNTPFDSNVEFNETSYRCQPGRSYARNHTKYYDSDLRSENETEQASQQLESDDESDITAVNEETESSESETESEPDQCDVVLSRVEKPVKKQEKNGIFSKMLKLFTPRSRKKSKKCNNSNLVDYRILNGNKTINPKSATKSLTNKSQAVSYSSKTQKNRNKTEHPQYTPYMEQEYRRHFDENLIFHDNHIPRSSTRGRSAPRKRPVYYQKVEMRSALVDHYYHNHNSQDQPATETKSIKYYSNKDNQKQENCGSNSAVRERSSNVPAKAVRWLKKHKFGIRCGPQWKKLILDG